MLPGGHWEESVRLVRRVAACCKADIEHTVRMLLLWLTRKSMLTSRSFFDAEIGESRNKPATGVDHCQEIIITGDAANINQYVREVRLLLRLAISARLDRS